MSLKMLFVDMNAYFASVEQQYRPELRGRPIGVIPMRAETTCCIASSYEARAMGVKTGTAVRDALALCPGIALVEARPELYVRVHHAIVAAVESCVPVHRIHSIDEMSCRLSTTDYSSERAVQKGREIKDAVRRRAGEYLKCSVGVGPNTFLAKVASDMQKPDGLTVIAAEDLPQRLYPLELTDFPGIGPRMNRRLTRQGIQTVEQLCSLSAEDMARVWGGIVGTRFWLALHGRDVPELPTRRRTVGHSHVLPPKLRTEPAAQGVLVRLLCKAAARMRRIGYCAGRLDVWMSFRGCGGWHDWTHLNDCRDTSSMVDAFIRLWTARRDRGQPFQVGLTLSDLVAEREATIPLFAGQRRRIALSRMMDRINGRYGRDMVHVGTVHTVLDSAPTRIAFSNVPDISDPTNWDEEEEDLERVVSSWCTEPPRPPTVYEPWAEDCRADDTPLR